MAYTALIRTYNSASTLPGTLVALARQTRPPDAIVIVDSGSTDSTLTGLPTNAYIHRFVGEFNYAEALNQGLQYVKTEFVLIISSHTSLKNEQAAAYAEDLLGARNRIGAVSFSGEPDTLNHEVIDAKNFNGFNGVWNTASLFRASLLRLRPFRPDVFSAEDQEWSRWLCFDHGMALARVSGSGLLISNARRHSSRKRQNEYIAIAMFVNRTLFEWRNIIRVGLGAVKPTAGRTLAVRLYKLQLFARLVLCRIRPHHIKSRYF